MEITKGSDLILVLKLEDFKDERMRVADCVDFRLKVWSSNPNNFLEFTKGDIIKDENYDKISIPDFMINCLESGVICYMAIYSKYDDNFDRSDNQYHKTRTYITDIYWRNCNLNEEPANPVNYQTLNWLINKIENNRLDCEQANQQIKDYISKDFTDKLNEEIERSNKVDVEMFNLIKNNQSQSDNKTSELTEKLDAEIKRSNEVDVEIFNLIKGNADQNKEELNNTNDKLNVEIERAKQADSDNQTAINNEVTRATNAETVLTTKIDNEVERAKTAEGAIRDAVENERDRAIAKEDILKDSIDTFKENISDRIEHINTDLHDEIERAKQSEYDLEQLIGDKTTDIENLNEYVGNLENTVEELQKSLEDEITNSAEKDDELEASITELTDDVDEIVDSVNEIEKAVKSSIDAIDIINGDENVIGSIKHSFEDSKHYTDDEIAKYKTSVNAQLQDYSTKSDVDDRIKKVIGAAPEALDTLEEIADVLSKDSDAITAINEVLTGKANSSDVYNKSQIDTKTTDINNAISTVETSLTNEVNRAKAAEKLNADAINVLNGDKDIIGSLAHILQDAKHYTDDEISKLNFATTNDVNELEGKLTAHKAEAETKYALKSEIPTEYDDTELSDRVAALEANAGGDVDLTDYYTKNESDAIYQTKGDYLTEHQSLDDYATKEYVDDAISNIETGDVDLSDYYTKEQVDAKVDSIDVYDDTDLSDRVAALEVKEDNDTIYDDTEIRTKLAEIENKFNGGDNFVVFQKVNTDGQEIYFFNEINSIGSFIEKYKQLMLGNWDYTNNNLIELDKEYKASELVFAATNSNPIIKINDEEITYKSLSVLDEQGNYVIVKVELNDTMAINSIQINTLQGIQITWGEYPTNNPICFISKSESLDDKITGLTNKIENIDIPDVDLSEYAKTAETTVIKDNDGNIITEMVIDNSDSDDTIEVYTKEQCDERFAKLWSGTQEQYDAITNKNNNTIYVII